MADGPIPADPPPLCRSCGQRHWFLDPCGLISPAVSDLGGQLDPPPTADEVTKAVRYYRAHLKRERERNRVRRAGA